MNINYISGFFDADGCISLGSLSKKYGYRTTVMITFTNTNKKVLEDIQKCLLEDYNINTSLRCSIDSRPSRSDRYDLTTNKINSLLLCKLLISYHPIKAFKIGIVNDLYHKVFSIKRHLIKEDDIKQRVSFNKLFYSM